MPSPRVASERPRTPHAANAPVLGQPACAAFRRPNARKGETTSVFQLTVPVSDVSQEFSPGMGHSRLEAEGEPECLW
jgi:hypothetical protein